jgi:galactofuranosylgalactofuranosylrhamnosyl-N-acetylglucosaminyl-diphospho-decaprenol beta-1,5/1,6-galactofuranosyltransferase
MAEKILQRVVLPPRRRLRRLYYRCNRPAEICQRGRRALMLPRGAMIRTDTYFNSFYESYWREYTSLQHLVLRLRVRGCGVVRLYRRTRGYETMLLDERDFSGESSVEIAVSGGEGLLYFEIEARASGLGLHGAEWLGRAVEPRPVRLAACICTFNRPAQLLRNLSRLFADRSAAACVQRVFVVDQGREKVRDHPEYDFVAGEKLHLVEQENYGGAGGFTRCLLEAKSDGAATHVLLMDDDVVFEPESIVRAAAFLSLARSAVAVAGHMLDRSRPRELVECGSRYLPEHLRIDEPRRRRVDSREGLTAFLEPEARHYGGWWFYAFPLATLERAGLPLPLFLRGDDVEFGCRLFHGGVPTLALPGVAVWHESFEAKARSWHPFYELRNLLIAGALHFPHTPARAVARPFFSRLLDELLTFDYYEAWLMCEAAAAYLRGPLALHKPDSRLHQRLISMRAELGVQATPRDAVLPPLSESLPPTGRLRRWRLILRNLLRSSPSLESAPERTLSGGEQWYDLADADVAAVEEPRRSEYVVLRRSRRHFVRLMLRASWLALRLFVRHRRVARAWRTAAPDLASPPFWKKYLNVPEVGLTRPHSPRRSENHPISCERKSL